jgi:DivIVA domain-containing protein
MTQITSDDVRMKKFSMHRLRLGYDPDEVDDYLDEVIAKLEEYEKARWS